MKGKQRVLDYAEVFDSWRTVPRIFLAASFVWTVYLTDRLLSWYMQLPHQERGVEASGFAAVVQVGVLGFLKMVYSDYARTGRDWNVSGTTTQVTAMSSTTKAP